MSGSIDKVVIIGAGQAGAEAAFRLRQGGFTGTITLVGEELEPPYQRPPLSKAYLMGELPVERLLLKPATAYGEENITLQTGRQAVAIDRVNKRVQMAKGEGLPYDALILATGSRARTLPLAGADLPGVHVLRTAGDVAAIRPDFVAGQRVVIIGAGYIGLEVAAVARKLGLSVTVLEMAPRPLARVTSPEVSGFFLDYHVKKGVRFELGVQPAVIKGGDRVRAIGLADGREIPCDLVIAGIGITPEATLAGEAGLTVENGIVVDAQMRTSDPAIFAIGDCANRPLVHYDNRRGRLESVHNALEGGKIAAAMILGQAPPKEEAPWFWSDQYDLKLQIAGLFTGYDRLVVRGSMQEAKFAAFYLRDGVLIAVDAVNSPPEYLGGKQLIQRRARIAPAALADLSRPFKDVMNDAT